MATQTPNSDFGSRTDTAIVSGSDARNKLKASLPKNWRKINSWITLFFLVLWGFWYVPGYFRSARQAMSSSTQEERPQVAPPDPRRYPSRMVVGREWSEWVENPANYYMVATPIEEVAYEAQVNLSNSEPYRVDRGGPIPRIAPPKKLQRVRFRVVEDEVVDRVTIQITYTPLPRKSPVRTSRHTIPTDTMLRIIAKCESGGQHFDREGNVLKNPGSNAIGKYQIMVPDHEVPAKRKGLDIWTEEGNEAYARYLLGTSWTREWEKDPLSKRCLERELQLL